MGNLALVLMYRVDHDTTAPKNYCPWCDIEFRREVCPKCKTVLRSGYTEEKPKKQPEFLTSKEIEYIRRRV